MENVQTATNCWQVCVESNYLHTTTKLRPKMLESRGNSRTNVRLVAVVAGDRQGKIGRINVDGHVENVKPAIPNC